ncbi:MAG: endonuclease [Betaproteobacteria bacterium]|nr:endonuclease [Betaproteobacteria bacterium]
MKPPAATLRVATYNIHKGVRGIGPRKRLEIHNLELGVASLKADLVMLQEVRLFHHREARRFAHGPQPWPLQGQAEFLAPEGYHSVYRTNAVTRHGEHGNALLCRWPLGAVGHHDVSDHRFEQRGLLHVTIDWLGSTLHAVVAHFGLMHTSRVRQAERLIQLIESEVPPDERLIVGGDFNDWGEKLDPVFERQGLSRASMPVLDSLGMASGPARPKPLSTFPSRIPVFALDRFYTRGLRCTAAQVPRGLNWARLSDHLPLVAEFESH